MPALLGMLVVVIRWWQSRKGTYTDEDLRRMSEEIRVTERR